jgi:hypothetical protein
VLRRFVSAGGLVAGGVALLLCAAPARAQDDPGFAFYRRDPADAGTRAAASSSACSCLSRFCRPPRCPPYCDPTFGYYPTAWRAWPSLYTGEVAETAPVPKRDATAPDSGGAPKTMPPATDEARRRQTVPGTLPSVTANVR